MNSRPSDRLPTIGRLKAVLAGDAFAAEVERLLGEASDLRGHVSLLEQQLADVDSDRARWNDLESNMPELLHAVSVTSGALRRIRRDITDLESAADGFPEVAERLAASLTELWDHLRTVRAEVLHELRNRTSAPNDPHAVAPEIVNPERVASLEERGPLRLNLGCGHLPLEEYANVDMRPLPGVDVVAALDDLPFEPAGIGEIHSAHVLEHFAVRDLSERLLGYWLGLLAPGGLFRCVVPDGAAMAEGLAAGEVSFEDYAAVLMGGQEYEGDFHFAVFSPESMCALLESAGFVDVEVVERGRRLDICLEMELQARRPA